MKLRLSKAQQKYWFVYWYWRQYEEYNWICEEQILGILDWLAPYILCTFSGHEPIDDQCGKPEHRYCWKCHILTPNAPTKY